MAKISRRSKGSVDDMLSAMKNALGNDAVEHSTVAAATDVDLDYIKEVEEAVMEKVGDEADDIVFKERGSALNCTVKYMDYITDFTIPYDDLYFNDVDLDSSYIANSIIEAIEEALGHRDNE